MRHRISVRVVRLASVDNDHGWRPAGATHYSANDKVLKYLYTRRSLNDAVTDAVHNSQCISAREIAFGLLQQSRSGLMVSTRSAWQRLRAMRRLRPGNDKGSRG